MKRALFSPADIANVDSFVSKYMQILRIHERRPIIKVMNNLGANWLGRDVWSPRNPDVTELQIQKTILHDPMTLERVVAHEMIHHREFLRMTPHDKEIIRLGLRGNGHGAPFLQGAAEVNAVMGPDFVTVKSDQSYAKSQTGKEYYVLITPTRYGSGVRLGWSWAARISPETMAEVVMKKRAEAGCVLVMVRDPKWAHSRAKIKRFGGVSFPSRPEEQLELQQMYERAKAGGESRMVDDWRIMNGSPRRM